MELCARLQHYASIGNHVTLHFLHNFSPAPQHQLLSSTCHTEAHGWLPGAGGERFGDIGRAFAACAAGSCLGFMYGVGLGYI